MRCQTMLNCGECGTDTQLCGSCEYGYVLSSNGSSCLMYCPEGEMCGTFNTPCYSAINNCSTTICASGENGYFIYLLINYFANLKSIQNILLLYFLT